MKKKRLMTIVVSCLSVFCLTNCSEPTSSSGSNDGSGTNDTSSQEKQDNTIFDAFSDTRPDFGSIFDFVDDYIKPDPPKPDTKVMVSIDASAGITFKDGTTSKEILSGSILNKKDFDLTNVKDGRTIEGFILAGEGYDELMILPNAPIGFNDVSITPILSPRQGYSRLKFGEGSSKINHAGTEGSFGKNDTIRHVSESIIHGGENNPVQMGNRFFEPSKITYNSEFRIDMHDKNAETESGVIQFYYYVENFGNEDIHFNLYTVNGSTEIKNNTYVDNRYRIDVDLKPGESKEYVSQYKFDTNSGGNRLVLFVADSNMNRADFGFSASCKLTKLENPEMKSELEEGLLVNINLDLPKGFTVASDYKNKQNSGNKIVLPSNEQIKNDTGKQLKGWYIKAKSPFIIDNNYMLAPEDITISPYFINPNSSGLIGLDDIGRYHADYAANLADDNKTVNVSLNNYIDQDNYLVTRVKNESPKLEVNDYMRLLTYVGPSNTDKGIKAGGKYHFDYTIVNLSDTPLTFVVAQVQGGVKLSVEEGAVFSDTITLNPLERKVVGINITLTNQNKNIMPFIIIKKENSNVDFTIDVKKTNL